MIKFHKIYFIISIVLFLIEVLIAKFTTGFIRYTFGDYLCVILLYTLIKSFVKLSNAKIVLLVLFIAYGVEFLQLTNLKNLYPESWKKTLQLILGTSFSIGDLVAYTAGVLSIYMIEKHLIKRTIQ